MALELLSPAGDLERLTAAVAYGADAVYLAGNEYGMRAFAGNFDRKGLRQAIDFAHSRGVAVHVTVNTNPRNRELAGLPEYLEQLRDWGADALIVGDPGVFALAKRHAPGVKLHMSTQAGVTNYAAARYWYDQGASRVILARELHLEEVAELVAKVPRALEVEAFVHGSMCVSWSGRCVLSNYMTGRDATRGACAQPCRYKYALMEEQRPGEYFPVFEAGGESFILSSRDMCMIDHIPELLDAGLTSLKIEGRAKSAYYAAIVTGAYRHAVDAALAGEPLDPVWREEVEKVSHRHYSTGFWFGEPGQYTQDARYIRTWQVAAQVVSCDEAGAALCVLNNKFRAGDALELVGPGLRPVAFRAEDLRDDTGAAAGEVRTPGSRFRLKLPCQAPAMSYLRREVGESPA